MPVDTCVDSNRHWFAERVMGLLRITPSCFGRSSPVCLRQCLNSNSELHLSPLFLDTKLKEKDCIVQASLEGSAHKAKGN